MVIRRRHQEPLLNYLKCYEASTTLPVKNTVVNGELGSWLQGSSPVQEVNSIRLVLGSFHLPVETHHPFSAQVFDDLKNVHNLPTIGSQCHTGSSTFITFPAGSSATGMILYVEVLPVYCAMEYDPNRNITSMIVRFGDMVSLDAISRRLSSLACHIMHPLLLPTLVIENLLAELTITLDNIALSRSNPRVPATPLPLLSTYAEVRYEAEICTQILVRLRELARTFPASVSSPTNTDLNSKTAAAAAASWIDSKLCYLSFSTQTILHRCKFLASATDGQLQRGTQELTASADYNTKIMTVLTLVFLPLSSTAAVFSMSFFDFAPENGQVSSKLWVFWAVAIALSLVSLIFMSSPITSYIRRKV